ncbi:MAG: carboxypeptidase regulatory-like domain-containing protein [Candidatus Cloacimonetes bacterium]|nr:carboxypeptidase regulatory-like domain-containing protein [Candidatus Cloacimonadota bacterium]
MFRKVLFLILFMAGTTLLWSEARGLTCRELAEPEEPSGARAQVWRGAENVVQQHVSEIDREGWELADSVNINTFLGAGEHVSVEYNGFTQELTVTQMSSGLAAEALDAIERAPKWIRAELENMLSQLDEEKQIFWAEVINEVDDPIIDEVAFCIATSSSQYLSSDYAHPEMYIQNAEMIYEYDTDLSYVEVIDYGNSVTDENYYSTTRYWSKDASGMVHQTEVPRDVYYWYIVHPKITDEIPAFISPDVLESNSTHNTNIVGPEEGYFWRDFLYNYADEGYPVLRNYLMQCDYANDFTTGYDSAIGAYTQWLGQSLVFTSNNERPHQPVRIYRKHIGRCGEHADMRVAIGRIALIPTTSIVCFTVDHTWNEFWDGEWIHWDGGSINNFYMYENGWGSNFGSVIEVRSDGLMTPVTQLYAPNYATLNVYAIDGEGKPLDGARVLIGLRLNNQVTGDMVGWTDNEGRYEFTIGDGHEYWVAMSSPWGSVEYQMFSESTVGGEEYNVELQVSAIIPELPLTQIDVPGDDEDDFRLVVEYEADSQVIYGNIVMDDTSENTWFCERREQGAVNFFMSDLVQYYSYLSAIPFEGFNTITESDFGIFSFEMPYPELGSWFAVLDNSNNIINPQWVKGSITLYRWEGMGGTGTIAGSVSDAFSGESLAGVEVRAGAFQTETSAAGEYTLDVYPGEYTVIFDHPLYERIRVNGIIAADEETAEVNAELSDDPIKPLHITISGNDETAAVINWDAPASLMSRSLEGYRVYRLLSEDEFNLENWEEITTEVIEETSYTDMQWLELEAGVYRYAVCAQYSAYTSDFAVTQELAYLMTADVIINVTANSGDTTEGALLTLHNLEGVNSPYNYEYVLPETGSITTDIRKGNYELTVTLPYYQNYVCELSILEDTSLDIELEELLTGATFPGVTDYILSWDAVPQDRHFVEYRIYIDGAEEPFAVTEDNFCDLSALDESWHTAAIEAVYSSGIATETGISFLDGTSLTCEELAYFSLDDDFSDEISGWQGSSNTIALTATPWGQGAEFLGTDFITIPANPAMTASALHYTTIFWVQANEQNTGWRGLIGRPGRDQCAWIHSENQYVHHRFHSSGGGTNDGAPNTPNGSFDWQEWQQVALVNDGRTVKTYINGELLAQGLVNGELVADSTDMYIGKSPDSPAAADYFFGIIDEVKIWNRGMSDLEIRQLYLIESELLGTGILMGQVRDAATGNTLSGVTVKAGIFEAVTAETGAYELTLPPGFYDVYAGLDDYLVQHQADVEVIAGETTLLDFEYELTGIDQEDLDIPETYKLSCYPNPLWLTDNLRSGVTFLLSGIISECDSELNIYNLKGQKVKQLTVHLYPGENQITWDGCDKSRKACSSGIYMYRINPGNNDLTGKLIILR